jgi:hypothetical protein
VTVYSYRRRVAVDARTQPTNLSTLSCLLRGPERGPAKVAAVLSER